MNALPAHLLSLAKRLGCALALAALLQGAAQASDGAGWTGPLSAADEARYRDIFALQAAGHWAAADALIAELEDDLLLGHVQAQRYLHPTDYRSRFKELKAWLETYADHPDARRIYKLARARQPQGASRPKRPKVAKDSLARARPLDAPKDYHSKKRLSRADRRKVRRLKSRIRRYVRNNYLTKTGRLIDQAETRRLFDQHEIDQATSDLAAGWFYYGKTEKAFQMALEVTVRAGADVPIAYWTAGLAAWRLGQIETATGLFERLAQAEAASRWNRAAGAYWAARGHDALADPAEAHRWLTLAARHGRTFYGLLAHRRLGIEPQLDFPPARFGPAEVAWLSAKPHGRRALGLVQVGRNAAAEQELLLLEGWHAPGTADALIALGQFADLNHFTLQLATRLLVEERAGWSYADLDAALFPLPPWRPQGGFALDRALVFAFMRQESSYDPRAKSPIGARGLMQLMPRTARGLSRQHSFRGRERALLYNPGLNLSLGQRYLQQLLRSRRVDGDVLRLTVAYNAGPGNLGKWQRRMKVGDDPLLFIETLPKLETRLFAERVLTNLWIYRLRFGQETPSLDALAADSWPSYLSLDDAPPQIAAGEPGGSAVPLPAAAP